MMPLDPAPGRSRHDAFSLIELLMVMTILAILAGVLMPGVRVVRESAKSAVCSTNLRQQALAIQAYAEDNQGHLPPSRVLGDDCNLYKSYGLAASLVQGAYLDSRVETFTAAPTRPMRTLFDCPAALAQETQWDATSQAFYLIPGNAFSDRAQRFTITRYGTGGQYALTTSYVANGTSGGLLANIPFNNLSGDDVATTVATTTHPILRLRPASALALVMDGTELAINNALGRIAGRHGSRTLTNVLFADGHVKAQNTAQDLQPAYQEKRTSGEVVFFMP